MVYSEDTAALICSFPRICGSLALAFPRLVLRHADDTCFVMLFKLTYRVNVVIFIPILHFIQARVGLCDRFAQHTAITTQRVATLEIC